MKNGLRIMIMAALTFLPILLPIAVTDEAIMPVSQIKRGMTGIGRTVFEGTKIEEFNAEIIDVLHNAMPKQDMILVKLSGHGLEETGVVAGMSGSPIYIDGKVIGAVAYAWPFAKKPIAGVTPIESMIDDAQHPVASQQKAVSMNVKKRGIKTPYGDLAPVMSPLMVSGLNPAVMDDLAEAMAPFNLTPMRTGGASPTEPSPDPVPGSAIGVTLCRGDVELDAVGTLTYRQGNKIIAFGHPFMTAGELALPMTGARIHTILPSVNISTKMASALSEIGALSQDRQSGISGQIGKKVKLIPVDIKITNPATKYAESFHMDMGWDSALSVKTLDLLIRSALVSAEPSVGENTVASKLVVTFAGYPPLTLENTYYNNEGSYNKQLLEPIQRLIFNPYQEVRLESLNVTLNVDHGIRLALVKDMWMEEDSVKPGKVAHVHIKLKAFEGNEVDFPVEVTVPDEFRAGEKFLIGVAGGREVMPPVAPPADFAGIMKIFASAYQSTDLVLIQQMPSVGAVTEGFVLPDLPPSALRIMGPTNSNSSMLRQDLKFTPIPTNWVIMGKARLVVQVD